MDHKLDKDLLEKMIEKKSNTMDKEMNCILCKNIVEFLDNYKFTMKDDKNHFGNLEIYYCKSCDLGFVSPMPDIQNLNKYYKEVYRLKKINICR